MQYPAEKSIFEHIFQIEKQLTMPNPESKKPDSNRSKGTAAEDLAADFLEKKGFVIIRRNFHFGRNGEIDIIARDREHLVFVEVKSRRNNDFGSPEEGVTASKRKFLRKAAEGYLYVNKLENIECRFDFVGVDYSKMPTEIRHIINAI